METLHELYNEHAKAVERIKNIPLDDFVAYNTTLAEIKGLMKQIESVRQQSTAMSLEYWKQRCQAAERYISFSPVILI